MFPYPLIFLVTDFTHSGPYVGQLHARIAEESEAVRAVDLMHDAPAMRPDLAAYLLPAVCEPLPEGAIVAGVVDPGVGSTRRPVVIETASATFVGPDNGLFSQLSGIRRVTTIDWLPERLSPSFHGRDLFVPVAVRLALGQSVALTEVPATSLVGNDWPDSLAAVVYIDAYGNLMTGIDLRKGREINKVAIDGVALPHATTFSDVPPGTPFWYRNALGLLEIAVNGSSAAARFSLAPGDKILLD